MVRLWRFILFLLVLSGAALPEGGIVLADEKGEFDAALGALKGRFHSRAESEFAAFAAQYTNSARVPEAILRQAEARLQQTNYDGTIELLTRWLPQAGQWADEYTFWLAEAYLRKGDYQKAADEFANVVLRYPNSARRLEAAISETTTRARLKEWARVVQLLQQPDGVFQIAARANVTNELALRGHLLLAEAQYEQANYPAAETALQPVSNIQLSPRLAWQRQYLLCRLAAGQGQLEPALAQTTNLLTLATNVGAGPLTADSIALQAGLLERLGRTDEAMAAYERNLADGFPADLQRQALLKIAELALAKDRFDKAAQMLERFAEFREIPTRGVALLTLGELRLRQHLLQGATPPPAQGTNTAPSFIDRAVSALETLAKDFPGGELGGKAQLNLGWCHWLTDKLPQAEAAFQAATSLLPHSLAQATAWFKLGDTRLRLGNYPVAISNYNTLVSQYAADPAVRTNLFEPALYQCVRAAIAAKDLPSATNALSLLFASHPKGFHTERAILLAGQEIIRQGNPSAARQIFLEFAQLAPDAPLLPEVRLAIARTYEQDNDWPKAIEEYDRWLSIFTNSPALRPQTEYLNAWANFQAGRETNAFQLFTSFVARHPRHDCAPLAQWWVADYFFRTGKLREAEENFQLLYQSTNWPNPRFPYQARMMAGRTAVRREVWKDAIDYFTTLTGDTNCPAEIWTDAMFAYGNVLMMRDSTNKLSDYAWAANVFNSIHTRFPTEPAAVLALGEKAGCLLQWAQTDPQFDATGNEFRRVITNELANATARAIARVGLATVFENQAKTKPGAEQSAFYRQALNSYLDVFYYAKDLRPGEQPDLFWVQKAGLEAARLTETLQDWDQAIKIYEQLRQLVPALRPSLDRKLARANENLLKTKI